jgi:outer membrane protein OmpA-like peptidoglycan-associated protein
VNTAAQRTVEVCPGDGTAPIALTATGATNLPGHAPAYVWTLNGTPIPGATQGTYTYTVPDTPGTYRVGVNVTDNPGQSQDRRTATPVSRDLLLVNVLPYAPPTITGQATNPQIQVGQSTGLTITPRGTTCNRNMTYTCVSPEGTLTGNPPNQFNSTGVQFDPDRSRVQTKVVNVTCTVRDARNGTAQAVIPVTISQPQILVSRLDDVVFGANNSRVNNCGKRILLEELYSQLTEHPDWDLVVVGHTAPGERGAQLDRQRALNVIATMTAGKDTCKMLEPNRVRFSVVGNNAGGGDARPGFCGTSNRTPTKERAGQAVNANDPNAAGRRVEIYLVPPGAGVPAGAQPLQSVPLADVQKLGCPR